MNIGSVTASQPAQEVQGVSEKRANLQMLLLKKSLQMQQGASANAMEPSGGKGQIVDIRV
jgi:hypothetical protein